MEKDKKSNGAFVGLAVIIVILVVGGIYIWMSNQNSGAVSPVSQTSPSSQALTNQDSAQLNSLEQDINSANTSTGVDASTVN
jgi:flagellar basal body-associated protein FliL